MLTMELNIKDCKREGNNFTYHMTTAFTNFYLGYKQNNNGCYPPYIDVKGNEVKRFEFEGSAFGFDLYKNGNFNLKIKYRK